MIVNTNPFYMKEKFRIRQSILKTLFDKHMQSDIVNASHISEISLTWSQLINNNDFSETKIAEQIQYLINQNEIQEKEEDQHMFFYRITNIGKASYHDNKYLEQGKKESKENYFNNLRNWSTTILLIIASVTFIINIFMIYKNNSDTQEIRNELNKLKKEINQEKKAK